MVYQRRLDRKLDRKCMIKIVDFVLFACASLGDDDLRDDLLHDGADLDEYSRECTRVSCYVLNEIRNPVLSFMKLPM